MIEPRLVTLQDLLTDRLAAALKGTQRREEQELCEQLRLKPHRLSEYRRKLLPES